MTLIYAYANENTTRDITIRDADGNEIVPTASDIIRVRIGREGETPKLEVDSNTPTVNGTTFTKGEPNRLRLDAQDLDFEPGVYSLTIDFYDNSDSDWKMVDKQIFSLEGE